MEGYFLTTDPPKRGATPLRLGSPFSSDHESILSALSSSEVDNEQGLSDDPLCTPASTSLLQMPKLSPSQAKRFTQSGLQMGKFKLLVVGDTGVGKSTLLRVLSSQSDIVHLDAHATVVSSAVRERYGSTRPYPEFWDDLDAGSEQPRLNRNVCLVDSAGYGDIFQGIDPILEYLDSAFREVSDTMNMTKPEKVLSLMVSSSSLTEFSHVDCCLYMFFGSVKPVDLEHIQAINHFCPVVPVIAKADLLSASDIARFKRDIVRGFHDAHVAPFFFDGQDGPFAISCVEEKEPEMLASVLMADSYRLDTPRLVNSELSILIRHLFDKTPYLRHAAARRFHSWALDCRLPQLSQVALPAPAADGDPVGASLAQLVPVEHTALIKAREATSPSFYVHLPPSKERAMRQTADWVMQLDKACRSENFHAVRRRSWAATRARRYSDGPQHSKTSRRQARVHSRLSDAILNVDPLNLKQLIYKSIHYVVKLLGIIAGIKMMVIMSSKFKMIPFNNLGGGWTTLSV